MYIATERPSGEGRTACASKTISSGNDQSDVTVSFFVRESGSGKKPLVIIDYEEFVKGFGSGTVSKRVESENFTVQLCLVQTWKGTDPRTIWYSNVRINVQEYIPTTPTPAPEPTPEPKPTPTSNFSVLPFRMNPPIFGSPSYSNFRFKE